MVIRCLALGQENIETFSIWHDILLLFRVKISNTTRQNAHNYLLSSLEIKCSNKFLKLSYKGKEFLSYFQDQDYREIDITA